jgi:hypothetical protein
MQKHKGTDYAMIHWNYLIGLENDVAKVARYIEFNVDNYGCYSLELSHLLLSIASEVDVIAKALIKKINPSCSLKSNICFYRRIIKPAFPKLCSISVAMPRDNLTFMPWDKWSNDATPDWWRAYNSVKHARNNAFHKGNLENTLNAFAGLHIMAFYYYKEDAENGRLLPLNLFKPGLDGRLIKSNVHPGMTSVRYIFP